MSKRRVIITCAVTGNAPFNAKHPNFPVTPAQIADACAEAADAGAAIVHIHARDPQTKLGVRDPKIFKDIVDRVRQSGKDIIINLTCGHGATFINDPENEGQMLLGSDVIGVEERIENLVLCRPDIASLDVTTGNQVEGSKEFIYFNPADTLRKMAIRYKELGVKPELEVFQGGDVLFANHLVEEGLVDGPAMYQLVLGVKWASPATSQTMLYLKSLIKGEHPWTSFGIGRDQFPMAAQSVLLGGHVRVGLEDNLYLERGIFASNGQLVERAVRIINDLGCQPATPEEAREMLSLEKPG